MKNYNNYYYCLILVERSRTNILMFDHGRFWSNTCAILVLQYIYNIQGEPPSFRITKQKKYKNVVKSKEKFINKTFRLITQ